MEGGSAAGDVGKRDGSTLFPDDTGDSPSMDTRPSKKAKSASLNPEEPGFSLMDPGSPYYPPETDPESPCHQMTEDYQPEENGPIIINYDPTEYIKTFICPPHPMETRSRSILKAKEACLDPQIKRFLNWIRKEKEEEMEERPTKAQLLSHAKGIAETALKHHYRNEETKYVLVKPLCFHYFREGESAYRHVNFTAKQMDQDDSEPVLFFAELTTRDGPCRPEDRWFSTCCCVLKDEILGGCLGKSKAHPNDALADFPRDLKHCYACTKKLKHPSGDQYTAGHISREWYYHNDY